MLEFDSSLKELVSFQPKTNLVDGSLENAGIENNLNVARIWILYYTAFVLHLVDNAFLLLPDQYLEKYAKWSKPWKTQCS